MTKNSSLFFSASFSKGFVAPNLPIATFRQGDKTLHFLLDSGSDENHIDTRMLDTLEHADPENKSTIEVTGIGGLIQTTRCSITFQSQDRSEEYTSDFLMSDLSETFDRIFEAHGIMLHGILGSNFLRTHHVVLDFQNLAAYSSPTALVQNKP